MPEFKIIGNPTPTVGEKQTYSVQDNFTTKIPLNNSQEKQDAFKQDIHWSIYQLKNNRWIHKPKNDKTGATVDYNFFQATLNYEGIKLVAKIGKDEAVMEIKTKKSIQRKITHVDFLDAAWNKPTRPFAYGDKLIVRVHCVNLDRCRGTVTLWEDDATKKAQRTDINKNNKATTLPLYIEGGKGEVQFFLTPDFAAMANKQSDQNNKTEGQFHEYYVTVEIFNQKTYESENVNVANPDHKKEESQKSIPAEQKVPSKKESKGIAPSDKKIHDYHEQKIAVKKEIWKNPFVENLNSFFMVDVADDVWNAKKNCVCKENNFYWSNKLTCKECKKVLEVCANLWGESNKKQKASELMAIIHLETGKNTFKPYADNGANYSGLIQFSDASAKKLGTTRSTLKKMTFVEQMDYVHDYFASKKEISNMVDLYLHVLKPNAVGNGNNPDYVLFDESISVPDGDGSQTSAEQRKINIGREPWVTKYGYSSNPSFMKEEEHTKRKKWVYTKQRYEDRWGFINGKTTVADVILELKQEHYTPGAKELFIGKCENIEEENDNITERAPWMKIAIDMAKEMKGCTEDKEPMYSNAKKFLKYCNNSFEPTNGTKGPWCAAFMNWSIKQTKNDVTNLPYKHKNSASSQAPLNDNNYKKIDEPIYGSIVVYRSINGKGHTGFLYGKTTTGKYILLGGNQDNTIRFDSYGDYTSNSKKKKLYGFYIPADYTINDNDKLNDNDIYENVDKINTKYGIIVEKSSGKTN